MLLVRPVSISCAWRKTLERAAPRPASRGYAVGRHAMHTTSSAALRALMGRALRAANSVAGIYRVYATFIKKTIHTHTRARTRTHTHVFSRERTRTHTQTHRDPDYGLRGLGKNEDNSVETANNLPLCSKKCRAMRVCIGNGVVAAQVANAAEALIRVAPASSCSVEEKLQN